MERLRHRADFLAAAAAVRAPASAFLLQLRRREDDGPARVGFTVSRKVGTATERNRARRRLRAVVRLSGAGAVTPGYDYVLVARRPALTLPFDRMVADFEGALRRARRNASTQGQADPAGAPKQLQGGKAAPTGTAG
jgi:ribonuclease P protein component